MDLEKVEDRRLERVEKLDEEHDRENAQEKQYFVKCEFYEQPDHNR